MVIFRSATRQIILPSPRLDDTDSLELQFIHHRAMSGKNYVYKKQSLPQHQFSLFFQNCDKPKILELISFLESSMGEQITYIDYNSVSWKGKILTLPFTSTHSSKNNNNFELLFELI